MGTALVVPLGDVVPLDVTITKDGVGGVVGLFPTVRVRDAATLGSYLDWTDMKFKVVGWGLRDLLMPDVGRGHYSTGLDLSAIVLPVPVAGDRYSAEYHVNNGAGIIGDDADVIVVTPAGGALTPAQAAQLLDLWRLEGLDKVGGPLVVSPTVRNAPGIIQTISHLGTAYIVKRT